MVDSIIQPSFAGGALSPALYGRVDLAKWHVGVATARNAYVDFEGGISNRPGTQFVGRCRDSTHEVIVRPFTYSKVQAYTLEFGHLYMRVIMDGGYVLEPGYAISAVTQADPGVVTAAAHTPFVAGDWVVISGVLGMTQIDNGPGQAWVVVSDSGTLITLQSVDGVRLNTTSFGAYTSGGTIARIFTLTTPYIGADLRELKFTQSNDVLTVTSNDYVEREITRSAHYVWTIAAVTYGAAQAAPTGTAAAIFGGLGVSTTYRYKITAINDDTGEESLASAVATATGGDITQAAGYVQATFTAAAGSSLYNVYRTPIASGADPGNTAIFGYVGSCTGSPFTDNNVIPDFTFTAPEAENPFAGGNNPACATYFQQRKIRGGLVDSAAELDGSKIGLFNNMGAAQPAQDDDAISFVLNSTQVNPIKFLVPMPTGLVALTQSTAWLINGGNPPPPLTPTSITALPQVFNGCSDVRPIVIGSQILYVEFTGNVVRDLAYNYLSGTFIGDDRSVLSRYLFKGRSIVDMDYAAAPAKLVWLIRDNGTFLSLTYLKEQDIYAWARHDSPRAKFKSVCCISEPPSEPHLPAGEDAAYFVVERVIPGVNGGNPVKYVERMHSREMQTPWGPSYGADTEEPLIGDVSTAWFVDCGAQYGPDLLTGACAVSGTSGVVTLTSAAGVFTAAMAGNGFAPGGGGYIVRMNGGVLQITAYTSANVVTATVIGGPPPAPGVYLDAASVPTLTNADTAEEGTWTCTRPVTSLSGLDYLEGQSVMILAGGNVEPAQAVTNGRITIATPQDIVTLGIGYTAQMKLLPLDVAMGASTVQNKREMVPRMGIRTVDTRGLKCGPNFRNLTEIKMRGPDVTPGQPIPLWSGVPDQQLIVDAQWMQGMQPCIQQDYPLPFSVVAVMPDLNIGDTPG